MGGFDRCRRRWALLMPVLVGLDAALPSVPPALVHVHIGSDAVVVVVVVAVSLSSVI